MRSHWLRFVLIGLALMAPQELIVNLHRKTTPGLYLMSLAGWLAMLSVIYAIRLFSMKYVRSRRAELWSSLALYAGVSLVMEWGLIGNSPWANPAANQAGLVAGWVSVFMIPRLFLESGHGALKRAVAAWYVVFLCALSLPFLLGRPNASAVAVTIYGYAVIPFLLLSLIYVASRIPAPGDSMKRNSPQGPIH